MLNDNQKAKIDEKIQNAFDSSVSKVEFFNCNNSTPQSTPKPQQRPRALCLYNVDMFWYLICVKWRSEEAKIDEKPQNAFDSSVSKVEFYNCNNSTPQSTQKSQ